MNRLLKLVVLNFFIFLKKRRNKKKYSSGFDFRNLKTAVICSAGIGDALMATPLIYNVYRESGNRKIDLISYSRVKEIFRFNKYVGNVFLFDKNKVIESARFFLKIRKAKYDLIFCAQPANTLFDAVLSSSSRFNIKIDKINKNILEEKINSLYDYIIPNDFSRHRVELNLDMGRKLGIEVKEDSSDINFEYPDDAPNGMKETVKNLASKKYICIHPGSGGAYKRWNLENFIELIKNIKNLSGDSIVLLGGKDEINLCREIEEKCGNVENFCGELNLFETGFVLSKSRLLICNDSGIMHLATAGKIPLIALFGPTNPLHIGPYAKNSVVIKKSDSMDSINVNDVLEKYISLNP